MALLKPIVINSGLTQQLQVGDVLDVVISSGQIASGQIGPEHLASGIVAVYASGSITSGLITSGNLGDNSVISGSIASGQIGPTHLSDASVQSGQIASGQIATPHLASGAVAVTLRIKTDGPYSGMRAVAVVSGAFIGHANIQSGLRPAIGIADFGVNGTASGVEVPVYLQGAIPLASGYELSGLFFNAPASGTFGTFWLISGAGQSGVLSRTIPASGIAQQKMGVLVNAGLGGGTIVVAPGPYIASGNPFAGIR